MNDRKRERERERERKSIIIIIIIYKIDKKNILDFRVYLLLLLLLLFEMYKIVVVAIEKCKFILFISSHFILLICLINLII